MGSLCICLFPLKMRNASFLIRDLWLELLKLIEQLNKTALAALSTGRVRFTALETENTVVAFRPSDSFLVCS